MPSVLRRLRDRGNIERAPSEFLFNGQPHPFELYPSSSLPGSPVEASMSNFPHTVRSIGNRSAIVGGAVSARSLALCQIKFAFRSKRDVSRLFGTQALSVLENPGGGLTQWGLLSRVEPDVAYHGNAYWRRTPDGRLVRLRPDWVQIMAGSTERPDAEEALLAADTELVGYVYKPGGIHSEHRAQFIAPTEMMHWAPEPHPLSNFMGESWVSGVFREIAADMQATDHVSKFFDNAATPNMVAKAPPAIVNPEQFGEWVDAMEGAHRGSFNAWRTVYVQAGTDIEVVGSELGKLAMADLHGGFETRVSTRSRVPATVALYREGNQGSALNGGNYGQIRRMWADSWFQSYAQGFCAAVGRIINVPGDAELTFDPNRVLLLQEDQLDAAEIRAKDAATIRTLVDGGYEPDAAVEFVRNNGNLRELIGGHTGLPSVQVQQAPPTATQPPAERSAGGDSDNLERAAWGLERAALAIGGSMSAQPPVINVEPTPVTINVEPTPVVVEVDVSPTPVTVENTVDVSPTPVTVENTVDVSPTPITVDNHMPPTPTPTVYVQEKDKTLKVKRDRDGRITEIKES